MLAIYRLGGHIPTPGMDAHRFEEFVTQNQGSFLGFIDLFSGGMFRRLTIFALGIMPYITASIILQLLTVVVPTLEKLQKEGELGRRKITQWTRYLTVGLALMQSFGIATALQNSEGGFVLNPGSRLHPDDDAEADHGYGVHHVAGRADHRARYRQRHVADHLRRYCGRPAARDQRNLQNVFVTRQWHVVPAADHHRR